MITHVIFDLSNTANMTHTFTPSAKTATKIDNHVVSYSSNFNEPYIIQAYYPSIKEISYHNRNEQDVVKGFNNSVVALWRIKTRK